MDYREDIGYETASRHSSSHSSSGDLKPWDDMVTYLKDYAKERPEVCALTCFGIGFILGWKLKPW